MKRAESADYMTCILNHNTYKYKYSVSATLGPTHQHPPASPHLPPAPTLPTKKATSSSPLQQPSTAASTLYRHLPPSQTIHSTTGAMGSTAVGGWRCFLAMVLMVAATSLLFCVTPANAQGACNGSCDAHAYCFTDNGGRTFYCACDSYYVGNGLTCKYSTWRVVLYILTSVIGFILIFFLCLSCLGYFRRQQQTQPMAYPMQPMPGYGYPPPAPPGPAQAGSANPNMYAYPPQQGYPPQTAYPPQTGYPVPGYTAPQDVANPGTSNKVPGPSGTV